MLARHVISALPLYDALYLCDIAGAQVDPHGLMSLVYRLRIWRVSEAPGLVSPTKAVQPRDTDDGKR